MSEATHQQLTVQRQTQQHGVCVDFIHGPNHSLPATLGGNIVNVPRHSCACKLKPAAAVEAEKLAQVDTVHFVASAEA
jgi:hypothetical protein